MAYGTTINNARWTFADLKTLLGKASPARSGDALAGLAASSAIERVAAQMALADLPLKEFLNVAVSPTKMMRFPASFLTVMIARPSPRCRT
jgi:ethanolamine ammonia-lyase large subunit